MISTRAEARPRHPTATVLIFRASMNSKPRVLVIGAGAVGQVFGHHLIRAGADVTFFVREAYRQTTARGFDMYGLRLLGSPEAIRVEGFGVVCTASEVAAKKFDQIYLALPSQAVTGTWLRDLVAVAGEATWISIQPGPDDREALLKAGVDPQRLISGMLSLVSYPAPLPGESPSRFPREGMAFWHPPLASTLFSGPRERLEDVLSVLRRGGFPARRHADVHREVSFFTAVLLPYLAALELSGWSLRKLVRGGGLQLGAAGAREASSIVAVAEGPKTLPARIAGLASIVRLGLWWVSKVAPFPFEAYLRLHFTKTNAQTRFILEALRGKAEERGVAAPALHELLAGRPRLEAEAGK